MSSSAVRVFVGSGEASVLERKTLIHSLRKNTKRPLDLFVFNGTHNAVEHNDEPPVLAPMSLRVKYRNFTEFSLYRFLIPQLCNHEGRAIFLDSDTVCLGDVGELFDTPMNGAAMMCIKAYDTGEWGPSVLLLDCSKCRFDLERILDEIEAQKYSYSEFTRLADAFLSVHPHRIEPLDPVWNSFDHCDSSTKLIHYTNLLTQPWKHRGHRLAGLWFSYFLEALECGALTEADVQKAVTRGYVRPDILKAARRSRQLGGGGIRAAGGSAVAPMHWLKRLPQRMLFSR